jgi:hypothetical protein
MRPRLLAFAAILAAVASCAPSDFAENTTTLERTLTVREIDRENRTFSVTGGGERFSIRANDGIANFDQIEVGDRVDVVYTQSVAVAMALPDDTGETAAIRAAARPALGARPGAFTGQALSAVVTFVAYDPRSNDATLRTQDGRLLITHVQPELRRFAAARQPGERIAVELVEAFAVTIEPAA